MSRLTQVASYEVLAFPSSVHSPWFVSAVQKPRNSQEIMILIAAVTLKVVIRLWQTHTETEHTWPPNSLRSTDVMDTRRRTISIRHQISSTLWDRRSPILDEEQTIEEGMSLREAEVALTKTFVGHLAQLHPVSTYLNKEYMSLYLPSL